MYIGIFCYWVLLHYNMSFKTIAGGFNGAFWLHGPLSEDQEKFQQIYQNYLVALNTKISVRFIIHVLTYYLLLYERVRNLAVSKEPWDISEVIRDKHRINKNIPGLGPQKKYSSRPTSTAEKARLSPMTPNCRMHAQMKYRTRLFITNYC